MGRDSNMGRQAVSNGLQVPSLIQKMLLYVREIKGNLMLVFASHLAAILRSEVDSGILENQFNPGVVLCRCKSLTIFLSDIISVTVKVLATHC